MLKKIIRRGLFLFSLMACLALVSQSSVVQARTPGSCSPLPTEFQVNSSSLTLSPSPHNGSSGITDFMTGRTNTFNNDSYTYDREDFYYDIDVVSGSGKADQVELYLASVCATYVARSNLARKVTVIKGPAWNNPAVRKIDLVILLHGTNQDSDDALGLFFGQYGSHPAIDAFPIDQSSALVDAATGLNIPRTDILVAAMNSGHSVENQGLQQWSVFGTFPMTIGSNVVDVLYRPDYGDLMADAKRVIKLKDTLKADNPRIRNVYLFGFSAGGSLVHNIACLFPDQFDGYGIADITLNESMYNHCGIHHRGDGTVITRQLFNQVGIYPTRLSFKPRPIFFVAGTHSPKASNDMGDATGGPIPGTGNCTADVDSEDCQEDWYGGAVGSDIIVKTTDPTTTAMNNSVLVSGQFDYESTVEKYLSLLRISGATYQSVRSAQPCNGSGASYCAPIASKQSRFCTGQGGRTYFKDDGSGQHDPMNSVHWIWARGGARALSYIEVYGGGHFTPGRGTDCGVLGRTHDFDSATEFLKFMSHYGDLRLK